MNIVGKWQEIYIQDKLFCNHYYSSKTSMNIIVTHTPMCSTTLLKSAYEPLANNNVNILLLTLVVQVRAKERFFR
jgi:hypothetical protein